MLPYKLIVFLLDDEPKAKTRKKKTFFFSVDSAESIHETSC